MGQAKNKSATNAESVKILIRRISHCYEDLHKNSGFTTGEMVEALCSVAVIQAFAAGATKEQFINYCSKIANDGFGSLTKP